MEPSDAALKLSMNFALKTGNQLCFIWKLLGIFPFWVQSTISENSQADLLIRVKESF